jgi:undecaprenyl-diphosphatase
MLNDIILAIVQAITELFPISSSGHLIIVSEILKVPANQLLLTFLHFWTALAILLYYYKDLIKMAKTKKGRWTLIYIVIATIPAAIAGVLFADKIEALLYSLIIVGINSIIWGFIMIYIEKVYNKQGFKNSKLSFKLSEFKETLIIGTAQILALIPGTSRSGVTTLTGMVLGKEKGDALDLSFLLGIPITLGPFLVDVLKMYFKNRSELMSFFSIEMLITGVITFIIGYLAINALASLKNRNFMTGFGIYRILLGIILIIFVIFK